MATIEKSSRNAFRLRATIRLAGLFGLWLLLSGCRTVSTPEQAAAAFWESMAQGDTESARIHATRESRYLVARQQNLEGASVRTKSAVVDGSATTVPTTLTLNQPTADNTLSFNTVVLKENGDWKVDYQQTLDNLLNVPLGEIFKSLRAIGNAINRELERQIPLFENQIRSFSEELIRQLNEFRRKLEKSMPPEKPPAAPGMI